MSDSTYKPKFLWRYVFSRDLATNVVETIPTILLNSKLTVFLRHDIWHFLGGAGVFFLFMFLLTIDQDVKYTAREKLHVF